MVVAPFEAQYRAVALVEGEPTEARGGGDERAASGGIQSEAHGVALMPLPDRLMSALLGQVLAGQVRLEPVEEAFPAGCRLGCDGAIIEDMRERQ